MKRYLIAIDSDGKCYVRETLVVTHDAETGNAIYRAKPLKRVPFKIKDIVELLEQRLTKSNRKSDA